MPFQTALVGLRWQAKERMVRPDEAAFLQDGRLDLPAQVLGDGDVMPVGEHHVAAEHRRVLPGEGFDVTQGAWHIIESGQDIAVEDRAELLLLG